MNVVINEFEPTPNQAPTTDAGSSTSKANAANKSDMKDIEKALRALDRRALRVRAY